MNDKKEVITVLALYMLLSWLVLTLAVHADDLRRERQEYQENIRRLEAEIVAWMPLPERYEPKEKENG